MSSISVVHQPFPSSSDPHGPFSSPFASEYGHESSTSASATFTVNPASVHPPSHSHSRNTSLSMRGRTPRTSIISNPGDRTSTGFEISPFGDPLLNEKEQHEEVASVSAAGGEKENVSSTVRTVEVWREIFLTSNGRDKALKLIQYAIRMYLLFHLRGSYYLRRKTKAPWEGDMIAGLEKAYSGLSLSRKCIILFNWLAPLASVSGPQTLPTSPIKSSGKQTQQPLLRKLLHAPPPVLLDLLCGVSDDLATFYKLGLVPSRIGHRAEKLADWCWFAGTLVDLVEVGVEMSVVGGAIREIESRLYKESMTIPGTATTTGQASDEVELIKLRRQHYWLQISRLKLLMDLIFVSYDVFHFKPYSNTAKTFSGLASAILSSMKLYDKHHGTLSRSVV